MAKNRFLRTCITCKRAKNKNELFRFVVIDNKVILDFYNKIQTRGFYTCKNRECIENMTVKNIKISLKKNINIELNTEEILEILKNNLYKRIISSLHLAKKSGMLVSTFNKFIEHAKLGESFKLIFVANDISKNSLKKIENLLKNSIVEKNIFNKSQLGDIAGKNFANVIALKDMPFIKSIIETLHIYSNLFDEGAYINGYGENS